MSENNRIVWSEGLFLRPQHFQQQERHLESWIEGRTGLPGNQPYQFWQAPAGVREKVRALYRRFN